MSIESSQSDRLKKVRTVVNVFAFMLLHLDVSAALCYIEHKRHTTQASVR